MVQTQALISNALEPRWDIQIPRHQAWVNPDEMLWQALARARGQAETVYTAKAQKTQLHTVPTHPQVEAALGRVQQALVQGQKILVCGDYDVDGMTGTALLVQGLSRLGAKVQWFLPHRFRDGYGLAEQAIRLAQQEGCTVLITADCGISDYERVQIAQQVGVDVVITDHHRLPEQLPPACAIFHPAVYGASFQGISGAGTAFKFLCLLAQRHYPQHDFSDLLDLVALGTIADVSPMVLENRLLCKLGLEALNENSRPGLRALAKVAGREAPFNEYDIGFVFGPRLNAAGRMDHAADALRLLLASNVATAMPLAQRLEKLNQDRRRLTELIFQQGLAQAGASQPYGLALFDPSWHAGVVGIVASKFVDAFGCPVVLMSQADRVVRGSGRSIPEVDMFALLRQSNPGFDSFGGHAQAGGFALKPEKVPEFQKRFDEATRMLAKAHVGPRIKADAWVTVEHLNLREAQALDQLRPYGLENNEPLFACGNITLKQVRAVGRDGQHAKLGLEAQTPQGRIGFEGIGFGLLSRACRMAGPVDILFSMGINRYMGATSLQLVVKDLRPASATGA